MWEIDIIHQILTFLYSIILGVTIAIIYDLQKAHRIVDDISSVRVFLQDIVFWLINTFLTFLFLMARCNGEVRGYVIIGEVIGFAFFRSTLSRFILPVFFWLFKFKNIITVKYRKNMTDFSLWLTKKLKKAHFLAKKLLKKIKIKEKTLESVG